MIRGNSIRSCTMRNGLCFDLVSHLHSLRRHVTKPALREAVPINVGLADRQLIRRRNQREYPRSSHQEARAKPCQCPNIDLLQELLLVCLQVRYYKLLLPRYCTLVERAHGSSDCVEAVKCHRHEQVVGGVIRRHLQKRTGKA